MTKEEFILRAKKIHGDKYDYSKIKDDNLINDKNILLQKINE